MILVSVKWKAARFLAIDLFLERRKEEAEERNFQVRHNRAESRYTTEKNL